MIRNRILLTLSFLVASSLPLLAQEGPVNTQAVVTVDSKSPQTLSVQNLKVKVNGPDTGIASVTRVPTNGTQIALLIDDGLRSSVGRQISDLKSFINSLPAGTEIFVGYMQNGRVISSQDFTTDH